MEQLEGIVAMDSCSPPTLLVFNFHGTTNWTSDSGKDGALERKRSTVAREDKIHHSTSRTGVSRG